MQENIEKLGGKIFNLADNTWVAYIPSFLVSSQEEFDSTWEKHPREFHKIKMFGKDVNIPRWQQSYGYSYNYSGSVSVSLEPDDLIKSLMSKMNSLVNDPNCFNMCLCNWYMPQHYIGPHSDDTRQLNPNSPIASLSWGYPRTFILKPIKDGESLSITLNDGDLVIMGGECQKTHKHEIKKLSEKEQKIAGPRINFTFRSFKNY
jgi:alkylated DNA repair dioxygenase AlkB